MVGNDLQRLGFQGLDVKAWFSRLGVHGGSQCQMGRGSMLGVHIHGWLCPRWLGMRGGKGDGCMMCSHPCVSVALMWCLATMKGVRGIQVGIQFPFKC